MFLWCVTWNFFECILNMLVRCLFIKFQYIQQYCGRNPVLQVLTYTPVFDPFWRFRIHLIFLVIFLNYIRRIDIYSFLLCIFLKYTAKPLNFSLSHIHPYMMIKNILNQILQENIKSIKYSYIIPYIFISCIFSMQIYVL